MDHSSGRAKYREHVIKNLGRAMSEDQILRQVRPAADKIDSANLHSYYDKSWALVVGINDYGGRHPRLANAKSDANEFAKLLEERFDFKRENIITLFDDQATHDAILGLLKTELPQKVKHNDRLIFFFAGHGATQEATLGGTYGYLIPYDAYASKYHEYIDMDELRKACGLIPAKHIFMILDCCFSGIAAIAFRSELKVPSIIVDSYLQKITEQRAWQVLTAGDSESPVADSGIIPGHSAFTAALLDGLGGAADKNGDNLITAKELGIYVQERVSKETSQGGSQCQYPYFGFFSDTQGDFAFFMTDYGKVTTLGESAKFSVDPTPMPILSQSESSNSQVDRLKKIKEIAKKFWNWKGFVLILIVQSYVRLVYATWGDYDRWWNATRNFVTLDFLGGALLFLFFAALIDSYNQSTHLNNMYKNLIEDAKTLSFIDKNEDAIQIYDKAIELNPGVTDAWYGKGIVLNSLGNHEDAIQAYDRVIIINPLDADAWHSKGIALFEMGKYEDAINCYDKIIFPSHLRIQGGKRSKEILSQTWYQKGNALKALGNESEAKAAFDKAKELGYKGPID